MRRDPVSIVIPVVFIALMAWAIWYLASAAKRIASVVVAAL